MARSRQRLARQFLYIGLDMAHMTVAKWAASEGISRQAGYQAVTRCGIPVVNGKLDPEVASLLYRRRTRPRMRNVDPQTRPRRETEGLVELAHGIAGIIDSDAELLSEGLPYLRAVICAMDARTLGEVRLSLALWDALTGWSEEP